MKDHQPDSMEMVMSVPLKRGLKLAATKVVVFAVIIFVLIPSKCTKRDVEFAFCDAQRDKIVLNCTEYNATLTIYNNETLLPAEEKCCRDADEISKDLLTFNSKTFLYIISLGLLGLALLLYRPAWDVDWVGWKDFAKNGLSDRQRKIAQRVFHLLIATQMIMGPLATLPGVNFYTGYAVTNCPNNKDGEKSNCVIDHNCELINPWDIVVFVMNICFDVAVLAYIYYQKEEEKKRNSAVIQEEEEEKEPLVIK